MYSSLHSSKKLLAKAQGIVYVEFCQINYLYSCIKINKANVQKCRTDLIQMRQGGTHRIICFDFTQGIHCCIHILVYPRLRMTQPAGTLCPFFSWSPCHASVQRSRKVLPLSYGLPLRGQAGFSRRRKDDPQRLPPFSTVFPSDRRAFNESCVLVMSLV